MSAIFDRIFVLCPRGWETGGPEALHQLVDMLRSLGQEAYLVATAQTRGASPVAAYSRYNAPYADAIDDAHGNAVVVPELFLDALAPLRRARGFCWWLSIDNAPLFAKERGKLHGIPPMKLPSWRARLGARRSLSRVRRMDLKRYEHLTQSMYAWSFLHSRLDLVGSGLSDYTLCDADPPSLDRAWNTHRPCVAYNPRKGGHHIRALSASLPSEFKWLPIAGMNPAEVRRALSSADIYIDLGHHPGKDRLPREAAVSGALTLVARHGAGAYHADVSIPWEHKIDPRRGDLVSNARTVLQTVMRDLPGEWRKQDAYRSLVRNEKPVFRSEVENIFIRGRLGEDPVFSSLAGRPR